MKPEIKENIINQLFDGNLNSYMEIILDIGIVGSKSSDRFDLVVANPQGIRSFFVKSNNYKENLFYEYCHIIITEITDEAKILEMLKSRVALCEGNNWEEIVQKLKTFLCYEYDSYFGIESVVSM